MTVTNLNELREEWPQDESGRICRDLVVLYLTEKLLATSVQNDCNAVSAPAEAAAGKVFSALVVEFRSIGTVPPPVRTPVIKTLNRHIDMSKLEGKQPSL